MRFPRFRPQTAEQQARSDLLAALEAIDDPNYRAAAARIASDVRRGGARAAEVHLAQVAPTVAESFGALARLNPICAALTAYGRAALDVDLAAIPPADVRRRQAEDRMDRVRALAAQRGDQIVRAAQQRHVLRQFDMLTRRTK